jgi:hypothetical protein
VIPVQQWFLYIKKGSALFILSFFLYHEIAKKFQKTSHACYVVEVEDDVNFDRLGSNSKLIIDVLAKFITI